MSYSVKLIAGEKKKLLVDDESQIVHVCAYCRVSTDKQDQRNSLAAQTRFFEKEFAKHPNWIGKHIFYDNGISGTFLKKRDGFNRMIEMAKAGKYQLIITKDVSRFSRNVENAMSIVVDLQKRGVYIIFLSDAINTQRQEDRELLTAAIKQAEGESLKLSNKVRWGQQESMLEGVVFGRREMYAYNIDRDKETGKQRFIILPDEAAVVRRIFHMYAGGMGTYKIARQLEEDGIPTKQYKNGWSNVVILRILRNEKYVGDLCTGKTYTPDPLEHSKKYNRGESTMIMIRDHHPAEAIVDRSLWDKVQKRLMENSLSSKLSGKHADRYWCSGKIICGECFESYVSRKKKRKDGTTYKAWVCREAQQRGNKKIIQLGTGETKIVGCTSHFLNDQVLHQGIRDIISDLIKPDLSTTWQRIIELSNNCECADCLQTVKKLAELRAEINYKENIKVGLAIKNAAGIIDDSTYNAACNSIDIEILQIQEQLGLSSSNTRVEYDSCIEQLESLVALNNENFSEKIYRRIIKKIEVFNGKIIKYYFNSFSEPIILRYKTYGRGDGFRVEFSMITDMEFENEQVNNKNKSRIV